MLNCQPVLRIRDVYPGSRILIKELRYFNPKKWFLSTQKHDPGCSSRIQIPKPGSSGQKGTGSRIRIRNTAANKTLNVGKFLVPERQKDRIVCTSVAGREAGTSTETQIERQEGRQGGGVAADMLNAGRWKEDSQQAK
jgi:hypothetical protein